MRVIASGLAQNKPLKKRVHPQRGYRRHPMNTAIKTSEDQKKGLQHFLPQESKWKIKLIYSK